MNTCSQCNSQFEVTDLDRDFYKKMEVPEPTFCPVCRQQRRMAWANQINLYKRKCDATGKDIISIYAPDSPYKAYDQAYWFGDKWDATEYGREFDFSRPFFEQLHELSLAVPRAALQTAYAFCENSEYTNHAGYNKNCYMLFDSDFDWDCMYGLGVNKSKNCMDNYRIKECELCYECADCVKCYRLFYSQDCENCSDSAFLKNCIGVRNSFMCSNLKNKEYHIFNKPYDKNTYEKLVKSLSKHSELVKYFADWDDFKVKYPQKYMHGVQNENVIGDYIVFSKDSDYCFDSMEMRDCKYFTRCFGEAKDCMDCDECGEKIQLFYDTILCGYNQMNARFSFQCFQQSSNLTYCLETHFCQDCFGCVGLQRKKYCIFNKQYSKEEYEKLVLRIIEHMKKTSAIAGQAGEWGEFMPVKYSPFAYNETVAQEYHPLSKEEALKRGWKWRDEDRKEHQPATAQVPDDSAEADISICNALLACVDCGRNYKIVEQELTFYKAQGLTIPKRCFYCRHKKRFDLRNPRKLYDRSCDKCAASIKTTYAPERPEKVYCEPCYQESLS